MNEFQGLNPNKPPREEKEEKEPVEQEKEPVGTRGTTSEGMVRHHGDMMIGEKEEEEDKEPVAQQRNVVTNQIVIQNLPPGTSTNQGRLFEGLRGRSTNRSPEKSWMG
mmetsp:Transcript_57539/g.78467  ORF Transcript_57539/g.78467 Transcript_57539/m.78467 type:complete len:108 (+) Transcript_57539:543-866(+)